MAETESRRSPKELSCLGAEVYERRVRPTVRPEDEHKFVAIDVDSEEFEIDANDYLAITRLLARVPKADAWLGRIGHPTAYKMRRGR